MFVTVAAGRELLESVEALLADGRAPKIVVDITSVSVEDSARARERLAAAGAQLLAAPVSGNAKVIEAGKLGFVVSGPKDAYERAQPFLALMGKGASWVGEGELARVAKICHNVFLGVVIQSLAEITVLANKAGMPRHAFLEFLNQSVMGSTFSRYKSPAIVNLDFTPTFTPVLLRKDFDLGMTAAKQLGVSMPVSSLSSELVAAAIGAGHVSEDFAVLLLEQARNSGLVMEPENIEVDDGLSGAS